MAVSSVELIVDASKAINPLKRVTAETKKLEAATKKSTAELTKSGREIKTAANGMKFFIDAAGRARKVNGQFVTTAEAAAAGLQRQGRAAEKTSKSVSKLGNAVRTLTVGFTAVQAFKFVIFKTAELERQTKSLEVLTGSLGNARNIIAELQQFGAVTPFTSAELIETAKRLKAFGFETEQVVDVTKRLADVAGATGAELGGIATAFGQIQAKGRLQGEELLQLQERGIGLQDELVKMYGFTADEFRKALEGGRISADAVNVALQNITNTGGKYANGAIAQSETLAGKFSTLADQIERVAQKIGEKLTPLLRGALTIAINLVDNINRSFAAASLTDQQKQGFKREAEQEVMRFAGPMPGGAFGAGQVVVRHLGKTYTGSASSVVSQITNDLINREVERMVEGARGPTVNAPTVQTLPSLLSARGGTGGTQGKTPEEIAVEATKGQIANLKQQATLATGLTQQEKDMLKLKIDIQKVEANRALIGDELTEEHIKQLEIAFAQKNIEQALNDDRDRAVQRLKDAAEAKAKADAAEKKRLEQIRGIYQGISDTIADGVVNSLKAAIDGTKSFAEVVTGVFTDLQNQLLQLIRNQIFFGNLTGTLTKGSGLFGSLFAGFLANGGPAQAGRAYMVGERGPEMFIPRSSGTVIPNNQLGGGGANVVVNVDATGSSVQGDEGSSRQLGALIGAAVQGEIIKQQRPGGLLSR